MALVFGAELSGNKVRGKATCLYRPSSGIGVCTIAVTQ